MAKSWGDIFQCYVRIGIGIIATLCCAVASANVSGTINVQGRLLSNAEHPIQDENIRLSIEILNGAKTCMLYRESQTISTLHTEGRYNLQVGSAKGDTKRAANDPGNEMELIYQNRSAIPTVVGSCTEEAYQPHAGESRYLRVSATANGQQQILGIDTELTSVPMAIVAGRAENLQGLGPEQFLRLGTTEALTQSNAELVFSEEKFPVLMDLLNGGAAKNATGIASGDLRGSYPSPEVRSLRGVPVSSSPLMMRGQFFRYNGSAWAPGYVSLSDLRSSVTGSGLFPGACSASQALSYSAIVDAFLCQELQFPTSANGSAESTATTWEKIAGNKPTSLSGYGIIDAVQNGGQAGSVKIGPADATELVLQTSAQPRVSISKEGVLNLHGSLAGTVGLRAPATALGAVWTLPISDGAAGHLLKTDGAGNLSWSTPPQAFNLDSVSNVKGALLVRGPASWTAVTPGQAGQVLQSQGMADVPVWSTPANKGTVTSVALGMPSFFTVANSPVLASGKFEVDMASQTSGKVLIAPSTGGKPAFRSMGIADLRAIDRGGGRFLTSSTCSVGQALVYSAATDTMYCSTLKVAAETNITGILPIANGGTGSASGSIKVAGPLRFESGPGSLLTLGGGPVSTDGNLTVGGQITTTRLGTFGELISNGPVRISGPVNIDANSTLNGTLNVNGSALGPQAKAYAYYGLDTQARILTTTARPDNVSIVAAGKVVAQEFGATSDRRAKTEIVGITDEQALRFVQSSEPVHFQWKESGQFNYGFIAQDIYRLGYPEMISIAPKAGVEEVVDNDGFVSPKDYQLNMNYSQVTPLLTKASKVAFERIAAQELELARLKKQLAELTHENERLVGGQKILVQEIVNIKKSLNMK